MTQGQYITRPTACVAIFLAAGCAPDFGPAVGPVPSSAAISAWPYLLTTEEIADLTEADRTSAQTLTGISADLAGRASALRARADRLGRTDVMSTAERRRLQDAAAARRQ